MSFDPLRCAEAAAQAALVLGAVVLPAAWDAMDGPLTMVLAGMFALLTMAVYALHAVTFDCFRLTGQRPGREFSYTASEE
jgi:hypothetical protein